MKISRFQGLHTLYTCELVANHIDSEPIPSATVLVNLTALCCWNDAERKLAEKFEI